MVQMISFKQFLNEASKFDLEKFKKDCSFILNELKGSGGKYLMLRGAQDVPEDWAIQEWKIRSISRNTNIDSHNKINDYFEQRFGEPFRNWMFATGRMDTAVAYSNFKSPSVIFPIGKFEWFSSDSDSFSDMTVALNNIAREIKNSTDSLSYDEVYSLATDNLIKKMENTNWYFNTDLLKCISNHNEIMFKCNKFYSFKYTGDTLNSPELTNFLKSL